MNAKNEDFSVFWDFKIAINYKGKADQGEGKNPTLHWFCICGVFLKYFFSGLCTGTYIKYFW